MEISERSEDFGFHKPEVWDKNAMNEEFTNASQPIAATERQTTPETTIPIVAEQILIDKKVVEAGKVRIVKHVRETEQTIDVPVVHEELDVTRVAVNRIVAEPPPPIRYEGDKMIISVLQETLVVEKRLLLVEELHVVKRQVETVAPQHVTLLSEELAVERTNVGKENADLENPPLG